MWALRCPIPFDRDTVGRLVLRQDKDREAWLPDKVGFSVGGSGSGFIFRRSAGTIEERDPEDGLTDTERKTLDAIREDFGDRGATAKEWRRAALTRGPKTGRLRLVVLARKKDCHAAEKRRARDSGK